MQYLWSRNEYKTKIYFVPFKVEINFSLQSQKNISDFYRNLTQAYAFMVCYK